jgi:hypothetical protein
MPFELHRISENTHLTVNVNQANEFGAFGSAGPLGKGVLRAHLKVETLRGAQNVTADADSPIAPIAHRQNPCLFSRVSEVRRDEDRYRERGESKSGSPWRGSCVGKF